MNRACHRTNSVLARFAFVRHSIDMGDSVETHAPILAAGGIVLQEGSRPRFAIVRLRRDKSWVLPKGKLYLGDWTILIRPAVSEYSMVPRNPWHMRAIGGPKREL